MIINEYQYVKSIIDTKQKPKEVSIKRLIYYIAKFFYENHKSDKPSDYKKFIFSELKLYNFDSSYYRESIYDKYITSICHKILKGKINHELANPIEISITQNELNLINKAPTEKHKKVLFTMYVLAKTRKYSNGWVNYSLKEIFQCANVTATRDEKIYMINDLKTWGYIYTLPSYDKVGFKVDYFEESEDNPIVFKISNFDNIGNQYIVSIRTGWKMCEYCGRLIKIKGPANKYCNKCASIIEAHNAKIRKRKQRKT